MRKTTLHGHSIHARSPTLETILMVEDTLKHSHSELSIPELKRKLPKKVMHQTLKVILHYLWKSGKMIYTPKGMHWIHKEPGHTRINDTAYFG